MQLQPNGQGKLILTLDSKDFTLGISPLQIPQNSIGGGFATAQAIDPYRFPGMICPGPLQVAYTGDTILGTPMSLQFLDNFFMYGYLLTSTNIYQIDAHGNISNHFPSNDLTYSPTSASYAHSIIKILPGQMLYFLDNDIGSFDRTNYINQYGSNYGNWTGKTTLANGIHRAVLYGKGVVFTNAAVGNSWYIGTIDMSTSPYTLNTQAFPLPPGFYAQDIRVENGLVEVLCDNSTGAITTGGGKVMIVTLDTSNLFSSSNSTTPNDILEIDDNSAMGLQNINGFPIILTKGRDAGNSIRKKDYWGWPSVQYLKSNNQSLREINPGLLTTLSSQLVIGNNVQQSVNTYGSPFATYSYRGVDNTGNFPDALTSPYFTTQAGVQCLGIMDGSLAVASFTSGSPGVTTLEYFPISYYTSYNNPDAQFQTNFISLPNRSTVDWIRFSTMKLTGNEAFTPQYFTDFDSTPISLTDGDMTSLNLDSNTNAKTYYGIGDLCYAIAIGGNWANSTTNNSTIPITKIEIGLSTSPK
jgi:hypothetical protein